MIFILSGCAGQPKNVHEMDRRNLNEYMNLSESHSYFLADLPEWANFNTSAQCVRKRNIKYLNLAKVAQSFSLDYQKTLQFQLLYNKELQNFKKETGIKFLPFKNEDELFYLVTNKIQAGFVPLKIPKFERVNIIWIDKNLKDPRPLEKLLNGPEMEKAPPVLVSLCLGDQEIRKYQEKIKFSDVNMAIIPTEMFSVFGPGNEQRSHFQLNFNNLFNKNQKLYIYLPKGSSLPFEFKGEYKIKHF